MPDNVKTVTLKNGLTVVFQKMPHVNTVSIGILVGAGSVSESKSQMGYSHFLEHMIFKGTEKRDYIAINRDIERFGGYLNAFTDRHYTLFYARILNEYSNVALDVLTDIVFNSTFPKEEIKKEKSVVLEEIAMYDDAPDEILADLFFEHSFPKSFLGYQILGTPKIISSIKRKDLVEYKNNLYQNKNIIISVAGNFDENFIVEQLSAITTENNFQKEKKEKPEFYYGFDYKEKEIEQAHIALGLETFSLFSKEKYALTLLNNILGATSSSRLYLRLREELGLCYSVFSSNHFDKKTGLLGFFTSTQPKNAEKLLDALKTEIKSLKKKEITDEEISIAKAQAKSSLLFGQESVSYCMQKNASQLFWYSNPIDMKDTIKNIEAVQKKDLYSVYEKIFEEQNKLSGYAIVPRGSGNPFPEALNIF